nr:radical SAM protein [uncultured Aminipila sp.]
MAQTNKIELLLVSCPSKVIDYPSLSLPALTGYLVSKGIKVKQTDLNIEIKDRLLTEEQLEHLYKIVLPLLLRLNSKDKTQYDMLKEFYLLLDRINNKHGFKKIVNLKHSCQQRDYTFLKDADSKVVLGDIFNISRSLDYLFNIIIQYDKYFEKNNISFIVFDIVKNVIDRIKFMNPKAIGLSMITTQNNFSLWFAQRIREQIGYKGHIFIGGAQPTKFEEIYLYDNKAIDSVVSGEGEETVFLLMKHLIEGNRDFATIPRLIYRIGFEIKKNNNTHYLRDNYCRPYPEYDGFPLEKYLSPVLPILASSNCPWKKCKFCAHKTAFREAYTERNSLDVVNEMEHFYQKYGTKLFHFADETITAEQGSKISKIIEERALPILWMSFARLDEEFTKEHINQWYRGGARVIEWGLESASNKVLESMNKGIRVEKAQEILHVAGSVGIRNKLLTWHNYPGETIQDLQKTMAFVKKNVQEGFAVPMFTLRNRLVLQVGSELYNECIINKNKKNYFDKVWLPASQYSINAKYFNRVNDDKAKLILIDAYFQELRKICALKDIFVACNENITFDLLLIQQKEE